MDTHCHLNFNVFDHDYKKIIDETLKKEIWMVLIGTNFKNSVKAAQIASYYKKGVYCAIGLHPIHIEKQRVVEGDAEFTTVGEDFQPDKYKELAYDSFNASKITRSFIKDRKCCGRVVAIGETGLDYFYIGEKSINDRKTVIQRQKIVFRNHIDLAKSLHLPLIIHTRGAVNDAYSVYDDLIDILNLESVNRANLISGIVHSFYGTLQQAKRLINMGFLIGINAQIIADQQLQDVVKNLSLNDLVIETDSPYFDPAMDNGKRNEPKNVQIVSENLAKLKNLSIYEINQITTQNALHLFNILG